MKIVSWNVNGIRGLHKKGLFMPALETLRPDMLCLQETKAQQHESVIDLPEYREYWNSAAKKGYSGTALFTKQEPLTVSANIPAPIARSYDLKDQYGDANDEGRVLTAEFNDFYLVTVYTPNSKGDLSRLPLRHKHWDPAFLAHCKTLEVRKPVIFCGDLNVAHTEDDLANPKENEGEHGFTREERAGVDALIEQGFVDSFRLFTAGRGFYTWWTPWRNARERNVGWRIDYVFVSSSLAARVKSAAIHPEILGSDHCPVSIDMEA